MSLSYLSEVQSLSPRMWTSKIFLVWSLAPPTSEKPLVVYHQTIFYLLMLLKSLAILQTQELPAGINEF